VAETPVPGATVHAVAQRHGVNTSQLFTWRKRFRGELNLPAITPARPAFAAAELAPVPGASEIAGAPPTGTDSVTSGGLLEIDLPQGGRVRISGAVEPAVVTAALRALMR
jgi:transposase